MHFFTAYYRVYVINLSTLADLLLMKHHVNFGIYTVMTASCMTVGLLYLVLLSWVHEIPMSFLLLLTFA